MVGDLESISGSMFSSIAGQTSRVRRSRNLGGSIFGNPESRTASVSASERVKDISICESRVSVRARSAYPFIANSPSIEYNVTWNLKRTEQGLEVNVSGWHRGFPFYEMFLNRHPQQRNGLYDFSSTSSGPSIMNLALEKIEFDRGPFNF